MPRKRRVGSSSEEAPLSSDASEEDEVSESLNVIKSVLQRYRKENKQLRKDKEALETDLQVLRASANTASPSRSRATSTARIKNLEKELKASKHEANKYKSRYEKLQAAELKRERRELEGGSDEGAGTLEDRCWEMKKLLRSFRSLIEEIVLEDPGDEGNHPDCAICYEALSKDTAAAFPCEHIFHMACICELDRHVMEQGSPRSLACPTCRQEWNFSEVVDVARTAGEQWQDLIEVATAWAKMDVARDDADFETSDKTSEPSFIENDLESADSEQEEEQGADGSVNVDARSQRGLEQLTEAAPHTPPPRSHKRRRLEELAAARSAKKQRR